MAERDYSIDALSGLMILGVLFVHTMSWSGLDNSLLYTIVEYCIFFRMPYFFYKSGVYYRQVADYQCIRGGGKLLRLFVKYSLVAYLIYCCILFIKDDFSITNVVKIPIKQLLVNGTLNSNLPLWFLTTFFAAKVLYNWFRNKGVKNIVILSIFAILTLSLFYFSQRPDWVSFPRYVYSISGAVFFISVGNQLKSIQFNKWIIIFATIGYCVIAIFSHSRVDMFENELIEGRYEIWMLSSILGIIILINLFKVLYNSYRFPFLSFINRNALPLFASHWIIYLVVSNLFIEPLSIENSYYKILIYATILLMYIGLLFFIEKRKNVTN